MTDRNRGSRFNIAWGQVLLMSVLVVITFLPFLLAINYVDLDHEAIAFDWRNSFHGAIWLENFGWLTRPFRTPPWSVWILLPLTALPFKLGWAVMSYLTTLIMVISVPRRPSRNLWLAGIFLLLTAHPTLRNFADVNLEAFVIAGLLLSLHGYNEKKPILLSLGILLAAVKPQGIFLVYAVVGLYMLKTFNWREIAKVVGICGGIFILTMLLWGQAWLSSLTTLPPGISLTTSLSTLGLPSVAITLIQISIAVISVFVAWRGEPKLDRSKIGLLVAASLLAAPYANGVSVVTLLAFGGIAILMKRLWLGVLVFLLYNLPYLQVFGVDQFTVLNSIYFMIIQLIVWTILLIDVYQQAASISEKSTPEIEETE